MGQTSSRDHFRNPDFAAALGEYVDLRRAGGMDYAAVAEELTERGQAITEKQCAALHAQWSASERRKAARQERRECGLLEEITPAAETPEPEPIEGPEINEANMIKVLRHLAEELVDRKPQWFFSCRPTLRDGQIWRSVKGPGTEGGTTWFKQAVLICEGESVVRVYPEHRMRRAYAPDSPSNSSMLRSKKPPRTQLYLEVLSLEKPSRIKALQKVQEIDRALKRGMITARARGVLEAQRERAVRKMESEEGGIKSILRMESILSRMATMMDLYLPGVTGFESGVEIAEATGRTRAAVSAQKLGMVRQDTRATHGRAGFEQVRAAKKHRERALLPKT